MQRFIRDYKDVITYFLPLRLCLLTLPSPWLAPSSDFAFAFDLKHNFPSVFHATLVFFFSLCSFSLGVHMHASDFTYQALRTENHPNLHSQYFFPRQASQFGG